MKKQSWMFEEGGNVDAKAWCSWVSFQESIPDKQTLLHTFDKLLWPLNATWRLTKQSSF